MNTHTYGIERAALIANEHYEHSCTEDRNLWVLTALWHCSRDAATSRASRTFHFNTFAKDLRMSTHITYFVCLFVGSVGQSGCFLFLAFKLGRSCMENRNQNNQVNHG